MPCKGLCQTLRELGGPRAKIKKARLSKLTAAVLLASWRYTYVGDILFRGISRPGP
jgi:hypothetical protein